MSHDALKLVTIGGGSSYTPELIEGYIKRREQLPIKEIWLVDIEAGMEKLKIVGAMAQRMVKAAGLDWEVHLTLDRQAALKDADFVSTQFRVGRLPARIKDERIPNYYGLIGQETNGAGGIFKAFRTVPVILDIVADMKRLCPQAWLINFTNPSGMITEAIRTYGHWDRVIGLCNVPVMAMLSEPELIGKTLDQLTYKFAGIDHFHWHRVWDESGQEVTMTIIDKLFGDNDAGLPTNIFDVPFFKDQLAAMRMIPCGYHRYYYRQEEMTAHGLAEYRENKTRAQQVTQIEEELFELYRDPELDYKPKQLAERGGAHYSDAACEAIASIYRDKKTHMVVSTLNQGSVPDLPSDHVVEVSAQIGAAGAVPMAFGHFQPAERGWLQLMKNMELVIVEAAVTGDYGLALQAFTMNPLIPSGATAKRVLDELLIAHQAYLPQFADKIQALIAAGIMVQDTVAAELSEVTQVVSD
ncbi:6-phospho-beta-glucosidase [Lactiplantibacillus paraplantarum]|mgnify:FL=1|uniref:6-phospho-alpha-glucosidase n=1 Tax=Lactiplantibacillus paraplantarum TaxID=60520 RepID=A0AAD0TXU2_9LACO|nr:6-phospho-beta-glucosidase [Lactiplantibacillus paraplantarum]AYJ39715.1 6-phospho-beta-glucosidase [Lactiplantibacillus paraplantarum]ERL45763.1 6-phospho-beta-glucosidase [Lactiplantibacillus paraplantarum]KRL50753.1 6-phospho-beta-glucosidase [Lactiplantibacillus paraplantarum DSM 10667]MCU4684790.1 6-phospho-beta-glucosidase [Lactiplantibacillus paraplantarum]MDL2063030.1 6-phospho-beta-glucosidase [Lactiplantibacillus paraplantarum]